MKKLMFLSTFSALLAMILLIGSTFSADISTEVNGNNGGSVSEGEGGGNWNNPNDYIYAYLYVTVLDDNGNDEAYLSVNVSRSDGGTIIRENQEVDAMEYSASACVYPGNWQGQANAVANVPGGQNDDRQRGFIGPGGLSSVYASGSSKRADFGLGHRTVSASCRVWGGGISANISITVSGI